MADSQTFCVHHSVRGPATGKGLCGDSLTGSFIDDSPAHLCSVTDYHLVRLRKSPHVLLDVRSAVQFSMCALPDALNIPV